MAATVEIKLAQAEDAGAILRFLRQATIESDAVMIPHLERVTTNEEEKNITVINDSNDCIILLAVLEQEIVGMVTVMRLAKQPEVGELGVVVEKQYWHQEIGQLLVDEAEYWFVNYSSLRRLTLDVFTDNVPAINLYRKMNFTVREHRIVSGRQALQMDFKFTKTDE